jgi:hypothetical protein
MGSPEESEMLNDVTMSNDHSYAHRSQPSNEAFTSVRESIRGGTCFGMCATTYMSVSMHRCFTSW